MTASMIVIEISVTPPNVGAGAIGLRNEPRGAWNEIGRKHPWLNGMWPPSVCRKALKHEPIVLP